MKIVFTGGGTGGHIFPIVAIIRELKKISKEKIEFFYIGPKDEFAQIFLSFENVKTKWIVCGKFRRYLSWKSIFQNLFDLFKIPVGILQSFFYIFFLNPDLIFSKGGFGSVM
jgi:UDP-N-acetylglucosamine--N-acetylmuramyl-(pentapeptide) pyrophosphoryl-undecaprenol N-acetylglucosamine transferase